MSPFKRARQAAHRLDYQHRSTCHLLRQLSEALEQIGSDTYERFTGGGFYDELIERYARMLTADADGTRVENFQTALLHATRRIDSAPQPAAPIESLLPA